MVMRQPMFVDVGKKSNQTLFNFQALLMRLPLMAQTNDSLVAATEKSDGTVTNAQVVNLGEVVDDDDTVAATIQAFIQLHKDIVDEDELLQLIIEQFTIDEATAQQLVANLEFAENEFDLEITNDNDYFIDSLIQTDKL